MMWRSLVNCEYQKVSDDLYSLYANQEDRSMMSINPAIKTPKSAQKQTQIIRKSTISLTAYYEGGYSFLLVKRQGNVGLYQQLNPGGIPVGYEVIIIQRNNKKEYPPASEDWSYLNYDNALEAFNQVVLNEEMNNPQV